MKKIGILFLIALSLSVVQVFSRSAYCVLTADKNSTVTGTVYFDQSDAKQPTKVKANVKGLAAGGVHGFHIHEKPVNFSQGCISAGAHYNPYAKQHGSPDDENRHVGDMGNIHANEAGLADYSYEDSHITLYTNYTIIGRSCVVHKQEDDLGQGGFEDSLTTGHAGERIACGIIYETNSAIVEEDKSLFKFLLKLILLILFGGACFFFMNRNHTYQNLEHN